MTNDEKTIFEQQLLNVKVAIKVMGLEVIHHPARYFEIQAQGGDFVGNKYVCTILCHNQTFEQHRPGRTIATVPNYCTSIQDAWRVVERMRGLGFGGMLQADFQGKWEAYFCQEDKSPSVHFSVYRESAPMAICLAALEVLDIECGEAV